MTTACGTARTPYAISGPFLNYLDLELATCMEHPNLMAENVVCSARGAAVK